MKSVLSAPALTVLTTLSASIAFCAQALANNDWQIDGTHSSANFVVKHMMVSNVHGQMSGVAGTVQYDGKNINGIKVNATLDPKTVSTGDSTRDEHLRGENFFQVDIYPQMSFVSSSAVPLKGGGFKLQGKLTMHGVSKEVEMDVEGPSEIFKDSKTGKERCGATARTTIKRKDFGISYNQALDNGGIAIGEDVKVTLDLELHRTATAEANSDSH